MLFKFAQAYLKTFFKLNGFDGDRKLKVNKSKARIKTIEKETINIRR